MKDRNRLRATIRIPADKPQSAICIVALSLDMVHCATLFRVFRALWTAGTSDHHKFHDMPKYAYCDVGADGFNSDQHDHHHTDHNHPVQYGLPKY